MNGSISHERGHCHKGNITKLCVDVHDVLCGLVVGTYGSSSEAECVCGEHTIVHIYIHIYYVLKTYHVYYMCVNRCVFLMQQCRGG